jgi:hypothetical protein
VAPHLVAAIERAGRRPTTGVLARAHLLPALSHIGRDDLAYALLLQQRCPAWNCTTQTYASNDPPRLQQRRCHLRNNLIALGRTDIAPVYPTSIGDRFPGRVDVRGREIGEPS